MLTIKNKSSLKRILLGVINRLHDKLSNSNNADISSNGELRFIREYLSSLTNKQEAYTFFDIGANKGEYTSLLIQLMKDKSSKYVVHMFEPVEASYQNILKIFRIKNILF